MIEYRRYLDNYVFHPTPHEILSLKEIDDNELQSAIDLFQEELNWNGMWSVEDAKQRIKDGWLFCVLKIDDKIRGWYWLNYEANESFNLYVHENFRGRGYGFGLISYIITAAKLRQLEYVIAKIDEWNGISKRLLIRCGFEVYIQ